MSKTTRTSKKQIHELEAMARETIDKSARLYARNEYDATGKAYAVINGTRTAYASNTALYDAVAEMVLTKQAEEFQPEPEPIIYATERTEAAEPAAHLADLAEQAAQDVETAATICDADAYDNRAQMYAAAAADEATRYDADDATETAKQCARELEERAEIIAQIEDPQHREYIRATAEAHQWTPDETRANVAYYAANRTANAAARALLAEYAETTGRTIEQDDDEYIAAHRVARDEITGVSARATEYDREIVAAMVERIAQAVRDDIPTGPEGYHPTYQRAELLAYLGEPDDYDVTAIEYEATAYDPATDRTVWAVDADELAIIAERHQLQFYAPAF